MDIGQGVGLTGLFPTNKQTNKKNNKNLFLHPLYCTCIFLFIKKCRKEIGERHWGSSQQTSAAFIAGEPTHQKQSSFYSVLQEFSFDRRCSIFLLPWCCTRNAHHHHHRNHRHHYCWCCCFCSGVGPSDRPGFFAIGSCTASISLWSVTQPHTCEVTAGARPVALSDS